MSFKDNVAALALVTAITTPGAALAFTGVGGCSVLPEYYRALGALQGNMTSACDMSVEQARRIVSTYDGSAAVSQAPAPRIGHHKVRRRAPREPRL